MRGASEQQLGFSLVRPDLLVPEDHPIRTIVGAADGHAEREHALKMLRRLRRRGFQPRTLG